MRPILIIVSDRPALFGRVDLSDRQTYRWSPDGDSPEPTEANPALATFCGDPTDPDTYRRLPEGRDVVAVIDLDRPERAVEVARALDQASPDAAFLVLCRRERPRLPRSLLSNCMDWVDFMNVDLRVELQRLENRRRVRRLRAFAEAAEVLPILLQPDPDPDAMAAALAVRALLRRKEPEAPIVSLGAVTRPENRRMAELLNVRVTAVTESELRAFEHLVAVDTQPAALAGADTRLAVIDHHPPVGGYETVFADIRPEYGATATMLTEYLRADDERRIRKRLATALVYGIKTDTASLSRGATAADVIAYAFLQERADAALLHRIERPSYAPDLARAFGHALADMSIEADVVAAVMPGVDEDELHVLADLADFLIEMEGIRWSAAAAVLPDRVVVKLRHIGEEAGAGALARRLVAGGGSGGGHATMAQAIIPRDGDPAGEVRSDALLERVRAGIADLLSAEQEDAPEAAREAEAAVGC